MIGSMILLEHQPLPVRRTTTWKQAMARCATLRRGRENGGSRVCLAGAYARNGAQMNWLAHVFLSEPSLDFRLGNLLADVVRGPQLDNMSPEFLRGVRRHRAIDSFTDAHDVVKRSRARIDTSRRRFSAVLVDVFYDHLLASRWNRYSSVPLERFTTDFYAEVKAARIPLPESAQTMLDRIVRHRLLESYAEVEGVHRSLHRLSMRLAARWNKPFALEAAVEDLIARRDAFVEDFDEFFPQLIRHAASLPEARVPQPPV